MSIKEAGGREGDGQIESLGRDVDPGDSFEDESPVNENRRDRRLTLPTVFVSNSNQNGHLSDSDDTDPTALKSFQSSPNLRHGFRRKGQRRKSNLKRSSTHLNSRPPARAIGTHSPMLPMKPKPSIASLQRSLSKSVGNLLSESEDCNSGDEVWVQPRSRSKLTLDLSPPKSLPRHLVNELMSSPSPSSFSLVSPPSIGRRRSSILDTLSGMLSKSQSNLTDLTDEAKSILDLLDRFKAYRPDDMPVLEFSQLSDILEESVLQVVYTLLEALHKVQNEGYLNAIDKSNVFMNMKQVLETHTEFWKTCIRPIIDEAVTERRPLNPEHLTKQVGLFEEEFNPLVEYCIKYVDCLSYIKTKQKNTDFREFIGWCNNQLRESFDRLDLRNVLIDPIQRIQKYHLLLNNIVNSTGDDDLKTQLEEFYKKVKTFNDILNTRKEEKEEQQKIEKIKERIESYHVLPTSNNETITRLLNPYNKLDLADPVPMLNTQRRFVSEHSCKMSSVMESKDFKDIDLFLFEDMLLITRIIRKKCRITKQPLALDRLQMEDLNDPTNTLMIYLNEYGSVIDVFTLHSSNPDTHRELIKSIRTHKENFERAKQQFLIEIDNRQHPVPPANIPPVILRNSPPTPSSGHVTSSPLTSTLYPDPSGRHPSQPLSRSASDHYPAAKRLNSDSNGGGNGSSNGGVNRVQSMPASNDKRALLVEQTLASTSSCSSSASTSSASICGVDTTTSGSGLSLDKSSTLSDIKETDKLQDLEEVEDGILVANHHHPDNQLCHQHLHQQQQHQPIPTPTTLKIEDCKKYDDTYISDNLSRDVVEKLEVSNKSKIISGTMTKGGSNDLNILHNTP